MSPDSGGRSSRSFVSKEKNVSQKDCVSAGSGEPGENHPQRHNSSKKMLKHAEGGAMGIGMEERKSGTVMATIHENTARSDGGDLDGAASFG